MALGPLYIYIFKVNYDNDSYIDCFSDRIIRRANIELSFFVPSLAENCWLARVAGHVKRQAGNVSHVWPCSVVLSLIEMQILMSVKQTSDALICTIFVLSRAA